MRRLAVFLVVAASGGGGGVMIAAGCGSDDGSAPPAIADGAADAIAEANPPTGLEPRPGKVACGATECSFVQGDPDASFCCDQSDAAVSCVAGHAGPCPSESLRFTCDEPADCPAGAPDCCITILRTGDGVFGGSACQAGCFVGNQVPMCRTNEQCGDAAPCRAIACKNKSFHACARPAACD